MKNKYIWIGIPLGIISPILFSYILMEVHFSDAFYGFSGIKEIWTSSVYGTLLRLSVIINLPIFMLLLRFNKDILARGYLIGTMIIGAYIVILHLN
jgi:hypothetical protein